MSQEDNQSVPPTQASAIAGSSVNSSVEPSEGPHRISINDPRSNPTTPTLLTPKLRLRKRHSYRRRKSSVSSHVEDDAIDENQNEDEIDEDESDHEPVTLKDRQEAINITHPFGLPIWKPALYKKSRSVTRNANSALHSVPSPDLYISPGNIFWAICFGWWLAMISFVVSIILFLTPFEGWRYAQVLQELSLYILWPFGKFVEKDDDWLDDTSSHEQQTDYFSHHDVDIEESETRPLLGRSLYINSRRNSRSEKFNLFEKLDEIGPSGVFFYFLFYTVLVICWLSVFPIPMAKLIFELLKHLNRKPLSLHFKSGSSRTTSRSAVLLCTYRAFGLQYYKYTYEGINIMFINLMPIVFFVIIDDRFLKHKFKDYFFSTEEFIFALSLASVIPLSYFIGTAVASISAQSSIGLGAVINATFGSIIEIILYAIALNRGKGKLTEGSIIGSIMAGVLLMPGVSMVSGGFKRKEQNFNSKSAGVTSTMLIMAIIGAFTPTLFFQTYAPYKMSCKPCDETLFAESCQICSHSEVEPIETPLYKDHVKPLMYFCSIILLLSYLIGLWFSLRTHAALVYQTPQERPERPQSIYQRWVPVNIIQQLLPHSPNFLQQQQQHINPQNEHLPPPLPRAMSAPSSAIPIQSILVHNDDNTINLASNVTFVLKHVNTTEKILGLTLFALVPNVTEFLNAMLFSLYGNIALR
ncbi:13280_t:CDS:2 [Rhizophagus irregularis]|nr:13280_t:CDS:2 [Rhizophagus irregularis]